jgi:predicted Zn-ribbon and HTH transcriptional regulator
MTRNPAESLMHHCEKCGHQWQQRGATRPVVCPRCKNYNWNKPKRKAQE